MYGTLESLDREYNHVYVASAVLEQILAYLEEGGDEYYEGTHKHPLVICSRTRADVVIALLAAHLSGVGPPVAGVLTTGKADYGLHSSKVRIHAVHDILCDEQTCACMWHCWPA